MRERRRYDRDYAQDFIPDPWGGYYPPAPFGGGMFYGLEGGGPSPFEPLTYPYGYDYYIERYEHIYAWPAGPEEARRGYGRREGGRPSPRSRAYGRRAGYPGRRPSSGHHFRRREREYGRPVEGWRSMRRTNRGSRYPEEG